jgi:hypothetical protein
VSKKIFLFQLLILASVFPPIAEAQEAKRLPDVIKAVRIYEPPSPPSIKSAKPLSATPVSHSILESRLQTPTREAPVSLFGTLTTVPGTDQVTQANVSNLPYVPPDTNGAVGDTQYVQWVNKAFAVFDKVTKNRLGLFPGNAFWSSGPCANNNDGDQITQWDKAGHRWVMMQPVFDTKPYYICLAVSKAPTIDTTSPVANQFDQFIFQMPAYPDYPKISVWPDAYYLSVSLYIQGLGFGGKFKGSYLCAIDRLAILGAASRSVTMQCFSQTSNGLPLPYQAVLPSDLDGKASELNGSSGDIGCTSPSTEPACPPLGTPNFFMSLGSGSSLSLWTFHVDFGTPANSRLTDPKNIPVAGFTEACNGGGSCIPQPNTNTVLGSTGDRLMYRLAYRNFFGDHDALLVTHSVTVAPPSPVVGVRWYEIRNPNLCTTNCIYQSGTFSPDANFRWLGSAAMDHKGNIAVGYSISSSSTNPSIAIAGRCSSDPPGQLGGETILSVGTGAQTNNVQNWGDYSGMTIDPVYDLTFWYTNEYMKTYGKLVWSTSISSFTLGSCP